MMMDDDVDDEDYDESHWSVWAPAKQMMFTPESWSGARLRRVYSTRVIKVLNVG